MNRALFTLLAVAGASAGVWHILGWSKARRRPAPSQDDVIQAQVREGVSASIDVRVRNGIVALRGTAHPEERDRALTHALSIPGVRRVYSDLEDGRSILETGAGKVGIAHPR